MKSSVQRILYFTLCSLILVGVVIYCTFFGGLLHTLTNADQVVNFALAKNATLSILPGAHTQLLKMPFFWLTSLAPYSLHHFVTVTALFCLATVGGCAFLIHKMTKNVWLSGTIFLLISLCLLMTPAAVKPGSPLPISMAMATTRNIEYLLLILGFVGAYTSGLHHRRSILGVSVVLFTLLFASDKLFLIMALGGILFTGILAGCIRQLYTVRRSVAALLIVVVSYVVSIGIIKLLPALGIVKILDGQATSPFAFALSAKSFLYAITGIASNFGANPVYSYGFSDGYGDALRASLKTPSIFTYGINALIMLACIISIGAVIILCIRRRSASQTSLTLLSLIGASLTALAAFVCTDHFYLVDARYLSIWVFAGFASLAYISTQISWKWLSRPYMIGAGIIIFFAFICGSITPYNEYRTHLSMNDVQRKNNHFISVALKQTNSRILMGDYWRTAIIQANMPSLRTIPMSSCTDRRTILINTQDTDITTQSFAYLWTKDGGPTDFKGCELQDVYKMLGEPNRTLVVEGTQPSKEEMILFYEGGTKNAPAYKPYKPLTAKISDLSSPFSAFPSLTTCPDPTKRIALTAAHEDDDILFMSPDLLKRIKEGSCVVTTYITAGDAAQDAPYWLGRQLGAQAAYAKMARSPNKWTERTVQVEKTNYVTVATLNNNPKITLIFLRLPDGNINGNGFAKTNHNSLKRLYETHKAGKPMTIKTVDGQSTYTYETLKNTLHHIFEHYQPSELWTQSATNGEARRHDHADHLAVGAITRELYLEYSKTTPLQYHVYKGYPATLQPSNVKGSEFEEKLDVFLEYGKHDSAVCHGRDKCLKDTTYGEFLRRQYRD